MDFSDTLLENEVTANVSDIESLESWNDSLYSEIDGLQSDIDEVWNELYNIENFDVITELQYELDALRETVEDNGWRIDELENE